MSLRKRISLFLLVLSAFAQAAITTAALHTPPVLQADGTRPPAPPIPWPPLAA